jgi:hypothetical protein
MCTLCIDELSPKLRTGVHRMPVSATLICYVALMIILALIVRWECARRRKGPLLKPGGLSQIDSSTPRISYTPPPERSKRAFQRARP